MTESKRELIADCVHCGFCLPSCPTYLLWGEEMDSPRGRIYLMKNVLEGASLDDSTVQHFDACLGCMACVTACPSGVQYDVLIESTRAEVEASVERKPRDAALRRMIFATFPYPRRLRAIRPLLRAYQATGAQRIVRKRMRGTLTTMAGLVPPLGPRERLPALIPAVGTRRMRVGMLLGCVQREFFPGVNAATVRVLAAEGCEVVVPADQQCCGALSLHSGREAEAIGRAKRLITAFEAAHVDAVVINAAGCGSSMKEYGRLLAGDPAWARRAALFAAKCRDVSELLVELGPVAQRHPLPGVAAYHDACHLSHAQGVRAQPRDLLRGIPGLELREIPEADICCGSAGVYNLLNPEPARELGDRKAANVRATGASLLITANPGCLMQIDSALRRQGEPIALAHTIEVLDASIRGADIRSIGVGSPR
ncbi:MAG TPA: heterodisulfide reductase-related iron-sulfur binding cluster [Mycobacteriales bacterium]|nr:heterodisulfide reductase-related iron-sulfur binding cluster [Mycobacteriales bacterium]